MGTPLTLAEREERVLRILEGPTRVDANTKAAYKAQLARMQLLWKRAVIHAPNETLVPCSWHASVEGEPA